LSIVNSNLTDLFNASNSKRSPSCDVSSSQQAVGLRLGGVPRRVPKGEKVFKEGDKANFFYVVASGVVRTYTVLSDGRRIIDDFHFADDILGLDSDAQHRFSADSVCDAVVTRFRRSDLNRILDCDNELCRQVQSSLLVSLGRAQDHLALLGLRPARERVQVFLGSMAERASRRGTPKLRIQQSDVADYLGLSRETVSRVLTTLKAIEPSKQARRPSIRLPVPGDYPRVALAGIGKQARSKIDRLHSKPTRSTL
jgi:CRP/FNR family nitrogen fixation transcriptional regulator